MTKLLFFGTQNFGTAMLQALVESRGYDIVGVVTQPDRPVGRNREIELSPAKKYALDHGLAVFQPETLKKAAEEKIFPEADVAVVCQYGLIIPQSVLDLFKKGTINVHASLLPAYRGASPIQSVLMNGETVTGITIMLMDAKMDHGPILTQSYLNIDKDDTYASLSAAMINPAADLLIRTLKDWLNGQIKPQEQDHSQATICKILSREDGKLDFTKTAGELYNLYRGTYPWPGIWCVWNGKRLKLPKIRPTSVKLEPGQVAIQNNNILIGCKEGSLEALEQQLEGKKAMDSRQFMAGYKNIDGAVLQ